ncbi:DUF262 domain-containing protein [Phocaeicola plebeius]|jgi:hypothetical protein|uniref:DUF262 domain-containing protein n=1 Tax=Phocaeicola plebeius TaxID=310297 RepID=UPI000E4AF16D|nr:DUF262 domain-containing protein [Phocaeicola plebeius]RHJ66833.1 DUF262 domain-containing protein [Phocaeicola plebeius]
MSDLVRSVSEIFNDSQLKQIYYNIPDYQRGYEWGENNVRLLLEDLKKFLDKIYISDTDKFLDDKLFYCLQHITIISKDNGEYYNVVDGQQRLTTIAIILAYFGKADLLKGKLKYSSREDTGEFLNNEIFTRKYWEQNDKEEDVKHKDEFYIRAAANMVQTWDKEQTWNSNQRKRYIEILLNRTKLIVNVVSGNEEMIFANINGAKAELDGADLLRAVQITHSSKEKYEITHSDNSNEVNEYRVKMGMLLDEINNWCGQKDVRTFLGRFLKDDSFDKSGFNEKLYPINYLYRMMYEMHPDNNMPFEFRFFEYGLDIKGNGVGDDNWEMYIELKRIYGFVRDWYESDEIYHYLSYLFSNFKSKVNFVAIYKTWENSKGKLSFITELKKEISKYILEIYSSDGENNEEPAKEKLKNDLANLSFSWYHNKESLVKILILLDVIYSCKSKYRLPINYFVSKGEDIEHIGCQTPNEEDLNNREKWLEYIKKLNDYKFDIDKGRLDEWWEKLLKEQEVIDDVTSNIIDELNSYGLNSIGNLVLLHSSQNRSYRNASFNTKKSIIIEDYYNNKYSIRPYTLKAFSSNHTSMWTLEDIKKSTETLAHDIIDFLI